MKRKLLTGVLTVLGLALIVVNPILGGALGLIFWIFLAWMVQTRKAGVFEGHPEASVADKLLKRLKNLLLIAGASFLVFVAGSILHNVQSAQSGGEEAIWLTVALAALGAFILATAGGLYTLVSGRRQIP